MAPLMKVVQSTTFGRFLFFHLLGYYIRATGNFHSGNLGNSRDSRDPKFSLGIPGNLWISV